MSVLIPARDEELTLADCLQAVLSQEAVAEVLVYDDESRDATREIALAWSARDSRVKLAATDPLPPNWCGKNFACSQLAAQASAEWLLFLDADARLKAGAVRSMLAEAQARRATFLSCWPRLRHESFWEKLLMPLLNFVVFSSYPAPLGVWRRDPALGIAHGACILVDKRTYQKVGGHAAVATEIFEDTRLARLWRERGEYSLCLDGQHVVEVRMYGSLAEIWFGFQKNFFPAFRKPVTFWSFLLVHAALFLVPFLILSPAALIVIAIRLLLALRFRHPVWSAVLHPVGECFLLALGVSSWWVCRSGRGVSWKGRRYQHP